nr:MAG TPA: hypothetical protein [Caudoviricetes sp.]
MQTVDGIQLLYTVFLCPKTIERKQSFLQSYFHMLITIKKT